MKKLPQYLSAFALTMAIWGAFLVPSAQAQFISDPAVVSQLQSTSPGSVLNGTSAWVARIGTGYSASTTGVNLYASTTIISPASQNFRVDIEGYTNSSYTGSATVCSYDSQNKIPAGFYNGIIAVDNFFQESGGGCVLKPNRYYTISLSFSTQTSAISQLYGVNQSVVPFSVTTNTVGVGVPFIMLKGLYSSLDPNLVNGGNPSGISTSTIQAYCNSSYSTSTGLFSDISNGVTYGACTAFAFLFVPNQNTLQGFQTLGSTAQSKIPFSYAYDVADIFGSLQASSTQNLPTYSIGLDIIDFSSSTAMGPIFPTSLDFLSTTTINKYLPPGMHDLLYNFAIFVIWVEVAFVIYRKIVPTKAKI